MCIRDSIYFAANAASATAGDTSITFAKVGDDVVIGSRGDFSVVANSTTRQKAESTGITVGGLASVSYTHLDVYKRQPIP